MLTLLMKAKFGERLDPEMLFHERLAELIRELCRSLEGGHWSSGSAFNRQDLWQIAKGVFDNSFQNGWWSMSMAARTQYLQDAAAPWVLSLDEIENIVDDIEALLFRSRQITDLAGSVGEIGGAEV
ncbi:MAG: hypothetical protein ACO1NM_00820 [Sphingobium phenoxybenzoativorans]